MAGHLTTCPNCDVNITPGANYCARCAKLGARNPMYRKLRDTKRRFSHGYYQVWVARGDFFFPMAHRSNEGLGGYVYEHRLLMAKHLSRCLLPWEVVHHKNGIRGDNKLENLELVSSMRYHLVDAQLKASVKRLGARVVAQDKVIKLLQWQIKGLTNTELRV